MRRRPGATRHAPLAPQATPFGADGREAEGEVVFIHLAPPHDVNLARMMARKGHYMKAEMLTSQEAILEELGPDEMGVRIDNAGEPAEVEAEMLAWVKAQGFGG